MKRSDINYTVERLQQIAKDKLFEQFGKQVYNAMINDRTRVKIPLEVLAQGIKASKRMDFARLADLVGRDEYSSSVSSEMIAQCTDGGKKVCARYLKTSSEQLEKCIAARESLKQKVMALSDEMFFKGMNGEVAIKLLKTVKL